MLSRLAKEKPYRPCHPVGFFLCYSSRQRQADRPGFAAACAGRDGRGRGPARGAALLCPARAAAAACSSCGPKCRLPRPEARPGLLRSVQQLRAAPLRAGAHSYPLPLVALARALLLARWRGYAYNVNYAQ